MAEPTQFFGATPPTADSPFWQNQPTASGRADDQRAQMRSDLQVYTVAQVADFLRCDPLLVNRIVAKGWLRAQDSPARDATWFAPKFDRVILGADLQAFIKGGSFDLFGFKFEGDRYGDTVSYYQAERFSNTLADAAAKDLPSEAQLRQYFAADIAAANAGAVQHTMLQYDLKAAMNLNNLMTGKRTDRYGCNANWFFAQKLRDATRMVLQQRDDLRKPGQSILGALFESPSRFQKIAWAGLEFMRDKWEAFTLLQTLVVWNPSNTSAAPTSTTLTISFSMSMARAMDLWIGPMNLAAKNLGELVERAF